MTEPTLNTLTRRLDRLERENRRLKFAGMLAVLPSWPRASTGLGPAATKGRLVKPGSPG
jgi:hypothetical protein